LRPILTAGARLYFPYIRPIERIFLGRRALEAAFYRIVRGRLRPDFQDNDRIMGESAFS
jgi:hypothetical protein